MATYGLIEAPTPEEIVLQEYEYYVESHNIWIPDVNEYTHITSRAGTATATGLTATIS